MSEGNWQLPWCQPGGLTPAAANPILPLSCDPYLPNQNQIRVYITYKHILHWKKIYWPSLQAFMAGRGGIECSSGYQKKYQWVMRLRGQQKSYSRSVSEEAVEISQIWHYTETFHQFFFWTEKPTWPWPLGQGGGIQPWTELIWQSTIYHNQKPQVEWHTNLHWHGFNQWSKTMLAVN